MRLAALTLAALFLALPAGPAAGKGGGEAAPAPAMDSDPDLVLHEWGTFTTVAGSDGVRLDGVHHDDEGLPAFVHDREREAEGFTGVQVKMETPIVYLYHPRGRTVSLAVEFPRGLLTQWYPGVRSLVPVVGPRPELARGRLDWGTFQVLPPGEGLDRLPEVPRGDPWSHARAVDANVLRVCSLPGPGAREHERFLFYRGLGRFDLSLRVAWKPADALHLENTGKGTLHRPLVLRVEKDRIRAAFLPDLPAGEAASAGALPPETTVEKVMDALAAELTAQGLYEREARAMVRTWRKSYFETPGTRVLVPLPREEVDAILPLEVRPAPGVSVRVLLARVDVLSREDEVRAEEVALVALDAADARERLGRFAEAILRRVAVTSTDPLARERAAELARALGPGR